MRFFAVRVLLVCGLAGGLFVPLLVFADDTAAVCDLPSLSTGGYYFEDFEEAEYVDGLLRVYLRLNTTGYNDGRTFYAAPSPVFVADGDCFIEETHGNLPPVSFTPGIVRYSFRMASPTHWVLWDDENDIPFECEHCSGDIPASTPYVSFLASIDGQQSTVFTVPRPPVAPREIEACCDSVLFLPGITGSRLYRPGTLSLSDRKLWEPFRNSDAEELALNADGSSVHADVYVKKGEVVDWAYEPVGPKIYRSFFGMLDILKNEGSIADFESVPYDWRLSFDDILGKGAEVEERISYTTATDTPYIAQELKRLAVSSQTGKVTIVAHSMGGLVAKELLRRLGNEDAQKYVSRLIMVGSPQAGTPKTIASMLHGYGQEVARGYFLDGAHARTFSTYSPGAYALLPSSAYFSTFQAPVVDLYGQLVSSAEGLSAFLSGGDGRVTPAADDLGDAAILDGALLVQASVLHNALDAWTPPEGVVVDQLAGFGEDTVSGIAYPLGGTVQPVFGDGDGSVITSSAILMPSTDVVKRYWVDLAAYNAQTDQNKHHGDIFEVSDVQDFIRSLIRQESTGTNRVTTSAVPASGTHFRLRLHSPLTIDLYDSAGRHTGIASSTSGPDVLHIDEEIPNSYYFELGDVVYLGIGGAATAVLDGYATSTFDLDVDEFLGDTLVATTSFVGVPATPETYATFSIGDSIDTSSHLDVDEDGDGDTDISLAPVEGQAIRYAPPEPEPEPPPPQGGLPGQGGGGLPAPDVSFAVALEIASTTTGLATTTVATTSDVVTITMPTAAPEPEEPVIVEQKRDRVARESPTLQIQHPSPQTAAAIQAIPDWRQMIADIFRKTFIQVARWFGKIE